MKTVRFTALAALLLLAALPLRAQNEQTEKKEAQSAADAAHQCHGDMAVAVDESRGKEPAALLRGGGIAEAEIRTDIYRHGSDPALFVDSFGNFVIPDVFFLCHASFSPSASSGAAVCASANC